MSRSTGAAAQHRLRKAICLIAFPLAFAAIAPAQQSESAKSSSSKGAGATVPEGQLPPEEDKANIQKQYTFNPLQSKKEVTVGEFYFKKGDYNAAAGRFREATKWNDGNADAWLRLGDAEAKMQDAGEARAAWQKYLQLSPQSKQAGEVRKKLGKLKT